MVLTRATIRDKLNLLLLVPLLATVLLALPFVAARVDEARAASVTAAAATNARQIADLLYAVQRERLAAVDHLTAEGHQHSLMLQHEAEVDDALADLRRNLETAPSPRLRAALGKLDVLETTRESVRRGTAQPDEVFDDYRKITDALFEALGLQVRTGDA
ncbi:MAG: nitrate- and nitrite sensing domain-containing protein, partial [Micromonosporaceae bacterium]